MQMMASTAVNYGKAMAPLLELNWLQMYLLAAEARTRCL
jgi:hypothetical protein